jgi:hypothetical protein
VAAKQLQVIFQTLLPTRVADRPPKEISRAQSDREVQPVHSNNSIRAGFGTVRRVAGGNWDSGISKNVLQSTPTGSKGLSVNGKASNINPEV